MSRIWLLGAAVFLVSGGAYAVEAEGDSTSAVQAACSTPDLPAASVDSCLERVRILEETQPSADLESLEARLEARVSADHEPVGPAAARSTPVEVRPYPSADSAQGSGTAGREHDAYEDRAATGAPRGLQKDQELPDDAATAEPESNAVPEVQPRPDAAPATDNPPPDADPEDEPPIADPPDDAAPRTGDDETSSSDDPG